MKTNKQTKGGSVGVRTDRVSERLAPTLRSRSEMRRLATQNPDTLISEIERLRAALKQAADVLHFLDDDGKNSFIRKEWEAALAVLARYNGK